MREWLFLAIFIGVPMLLPFLGSAWINRLAARRPPWALKFYRLHLQDFNASVSKLGLLKLLFWLPLIFIGSIIPLVGPILVIVVAGVPTLSSLQRSDSAITASETTEEVLRSLQRMQQEVGSAKRHLAGIAAELSSRQSELKASELLRTTLQEEIDGKLKEVEAWRALSEQQKTLFIQAARRAMRKYSIPQLLLIILGTIALNLVASWIWALLGAPGHQELLKNFDVLIGGIRR